MHNFLFFFLNEVAGESCSCFDFALRATLSTNGESIKSKGAVHPERSEAKSKGRKITFSIIS